MRADVRDLRAAQRSRPAKVARACMICGRHGLAAGAELCGRCRRELRPTPLDSVLDVLGLSARAFAEQTGIPLRTVLRAATGERMSTRIARRLAKITGLGVEAFQPESDR